MRLTVVNISPCVAVKAPRVDFAHVGADAEPLTKLYSSIQAPPRGVTNAVLVALGVTAQAAAFSYEGLLHQAANNTPHNSVPLITRIAFALGHHMVSQREQACTSVKHGEKLFDL